MLTGLVLTMGMPCALNAQASTGSKCLRPHLISGTQQINSRALLPRPSSRHARQPARAEAQMSAASVTLPASHVAASKAALEQLRASTANGSMDGGINSEFPQPYLAGTRLCTCAADLLDCLHCSVKASKYF